MTVDLTEKEKSILIKSICMAAAEGGYLYDSETTDDDIRDILRKLEADEKIVESAGEYWR